MHAIIATHIDSYSVWNPAKVIHFLKPCTDDHFSGKDNYYYYAHT
jgi:hypothetical protein